MLREKYFTILWEKFMEWVESLQCTTYKYLSLCEILDDDELGVSVRGRQLIIHL